MFAGSIISNQQVFTLNVKPKPKPTKQAKNQNKTQLKTKKPQPFLWVGITYLLGQNQARTDDKDTRENQKVKEETKMQRDIKSCPRSYSRLVAELAIASSFMPPTSLSSRAA